MEKRSIYTIQTLLEELKEKIPSFAKEMIFETLKPIYPSVKVPKEKRNITYRDVCCTKPLAVDRKSKNKFIKEESPLADFFKNTTRGDFLKVIEIDDKKALCINLSIHEEIIDKFYKDELISVSFDMIADGTVKQVKRKIDKYLQ